MVNHQKKIYVYENWSAVLPNKIGTLYVDVSKGKNLGIGKIEKYAPQKCLTFEAHIYHAGHFVYFSIASNRIFSSLAYCSA